MTAIGRRLRLRIGDSALADVGERRARVSRHLMEALDLEEGELLRVLGPHPILTTAMASEGEDEGLDVIRLDAAQRRRAGVAIGDVVEAERHALTQATRIRVMVIGHSGTYELTSDDLRTELSSQPVMSGDTIAVAPRRSRFDVEINILGITVAEVNGTSTECGAVLARILETVPPGVVQVGDETVISVETGLTRAADAAAPLGP